MFRRTSAFDWLITCALAALVIATPVTPALAQSATGSIEGSIVDQTGAAMPGVTVTVIQTATGVTRTAVSDDNGLFRIPLLPVGVYDVTADLSGFSSRKLPELMLTVGQTVTLRIQMAVSGVAETVNVSGGTPIIETSRSQVSSTITESSVQNLPVNGRNFIDFALLTPGVTRDVRTGDISFAGQRGTLNSLVVDGADNNNTFFGQTVGRTGSGRAPYQFSQDAVKEFQVNSNSFSAEYGRAGGAVINVVTKSGTNDLHGSVFEFYRDQGAQREQRHQRVEQPAEIALPLQPVRRHARRADPAESRLLLLQLRRPAQHAAEPRFPEPAREHADRRRDPGRNRAAAAARRQLESRARSGCLPHQDRPRAERHQSPVLPLQPAELHRRGFRERRPAELDRAHRRVARQDQHVQRELDQHLRHDGLQRAQVSVGARQGTGARQQRQPRSRRPAVRHDRADDRPQQLQPARNDDQALAGRRYRRPGSAASTSSRADSIFSSTTS